MTTWDGHERRGEAITISDVKNAVYEANEKFYEKVQQMCDGNLETSLLKHVQEYSHLDKPTKTLLHDMINNFQSRIKAKYSIGIPLALLFAERILSKMGIF